MRRRLLSLALSLALLSAWVTLGRGQALAHGMRTAYVEIVEVRAGFALMKFRLPMPAKDVVPVSPKGCQMRAEGVSPASEVGEVHSFTLQCDKPLGGQTVEVRGLGPVISDAVIWMTLVDGTLRTTVLTKEKSSWEIPGPGGPWSVAKQYIQLGVKHIATGPDHLLFLVLLVLLAKRLGPVLLAETAFTLSHSLAFYATATGLVRVLPEVAEACIALSLILLALDVGRRERVAHSWRTAAMALVFGLVHGLGFAGGLREVGIPDVHAAWALLGFGMGVEIGQVLFVLLVLVVLVPVRRGRQLSRLEWFVAYAAGSLSTFWFLERTLECWRLRA